MSKHTLPRAAMSEREGAIHGTRRQLLAAVPSDVGFVAGCTVTETTPDTGTDTPFTIDPDVLTAGASVVAPPSESNPLTVRMTLTNTHSAAVHLIPERFQSLLQYLPPMDGGTVDIVPLRTTGGFAVEPESRTDGCWRLEGESPADVQARIPRSPPYRGTIDAGERYQVQQYMYHNIGDGPCFPDGVYSSTKRLRFDDDGSQQATPDGVTGPTVEFTYRLDARDVSEISFTVAGPSRVGTGNDE